MLRVIALILALTASGCGANVSSPPTVNMPASFGPEETQKLLRSIDMTQLQAEINKQFPEANGNVSGFTYRPLIFKSATGKPDRMVVRVEVSASEDWEQADDLEQYLVEFLREKVDGT